MASLRDIKRRITSVQSTQKITRAMELIAATRVVKAMGRANAARPYASKITGVIEDLADQSERGLEIARNMNLSSITKEFGDGVIQELDYGMDPDVVTQRADELIRVIKENGWKLEHYCEVHRLESRTLVGRTITTKCNTNLLGAQRFCRQCRADNQWRTGTDNRIGSEHALVEVGDVHRTAFALTQATGTTVDLFHHANHVTAFRDAVAVSAVG